MGLRSSIQEKHAFFSTGQNTRNVTQVFSGVIWDLGILVSLSHKKVVFNHVLPPRLVNIILPKGVCVGGGGMRVSVCARA